MESTAKRGFIVIYIPEKWLETDEVSASLDHSISMIFYECFSSTIFNEA